MESGCVQRQGFVPGRFPSTPDLPIDMVGNISAVLNLLIFEYRSSMRDLLKKSWTNNNAFVIGGRSR